MPRSRPCATFVVLLSVLGALPGSSGQGLRGLVKDVQAGMKHFKKGKMAFKQGNQAKKEYTKLTSKPMPFVVTRHRLVRRYAQCGAHRLQLQSSILASGRYPSTTDCANDVANHEARYFLYGLTGECFVEFTEDESCPEGFTNSSLDLFALDNFRVRARLVKSHSECKAKGVLLGNFETVTKCSQEVVKQSGIYFNYGTVFPKSGKCYLKKTDSEECDEGFEKDVYDFYTFHYSMLQSASFMGQVGAKIVKEDVECKSQDEYVGWFARLQGCADAVKERGGQFFLYGKGFKRWLCYMEFTDTGDCEEGFQHANYDFYELEDLRPLLKKVLQGINATRAKKDSWWPR